MNYLTWHGGALARMCADAERPEHQWLGPFIKTANTLSRAARERSGRRGNGIDHYLFWSVAYVDKLRKGVRYPIAELAADTGRDRAYIRDTIRDARTRYGLLTPVGQGRAGGDLSEKALRLLAEHQRTKEVQENDKPSSKRA